MTHTDDALTDAVAKALYEVMHTGLSWGDIEADEPYKGYGTSLKDHYRDAARASIAAVRAHDEQAALNCGHCTPNTDEIACACQIEERDDE